MGLLGRPLADEPGELAVRAESACARKDLVSKERSSGRCRRRPWSMERSGADVSPALAQDKTRTGAGRAGQLGAHRGTAPAGVHCRHLGCGAPNVETLLHRELPQAGLSRIIALIEEAREKKDFKQN